jgi:hypothetical protein
MKDGFVTATLGLTVFLKDEEVAPGIGRNREGELRPFRVFNFNT